MATCTWRSTPCCQPHSGLRFRASTAPAKRRQHKPVPTRSVSTIKGVLPDSLAFEDKQEPVLAQELRYGVSIIDKKNLPTA